MPKRINKKPIWIRPSRVLFIIIGILISAVAIVRIQNYYQPYLFGLIFGGLGISVGIWTSTKLKYYTYFDISVLLFGLFLMVGSFINESSPKECNKYQVTDRKQYTMRGRSSYILYVDINGESRKLKCSYEFWKSNLKSQSINLCLHDGKLGFDYISAKDDKWTSHF